MPNLCGRIAEHDLFERMIIFLIVLNALSMGAETFPELSTDYGDFFDATYIISQVIFAAEIIIRIGAHAPHFLRFFKGFWNWFDFIIVMASFLPAIGSFALVARIVRVLRVLRLVSVSDHLREYLERMHCTLDIIAFSGLIWAVLVYVFAISGFYLFGEIDPNRWGTLWSCTKTVLYLSLLQEVQSSAEAIVDRTLSGFIFFVFFYGALITLALNTLAAVFHDFTQAKKAQQ